MIRDIHTKSSDTELLKLYKQSGNQEILGKLYNRYMHLILGLCIKYFKDKELAKDAVIDIYELISKKLKTHEVEYFKSWLYMVTKNHCLEKLRKANTHLVKEKNANLMYSEQVFHPDSITDPEMLKKLKLCMDQLPKEQNQCVELFYLKEKSYHEICALTSMTWNKVRSYVQNGRRNLKLCMTSK